MKIFQYMLILNLLILTALFPEENERLKLIMFPLPHTGLKKEEINDVYRRIEENFSKSDRFLIMEVGEKDGAIKDLHIKKQDIGKDDAIKIGRYLDSHFIVLYQLKKEDTYILSIEIIGIGYYSIQREIFVKHTDDLPSVEYLVNTAVDYLFERIFLVDVFIEKNRLYLLGSEIKRKKRKSKEPLPATDNFFMENKFFVSLNVAYNIPFGQYDILDSFIYGDLFFDYSLFSTDIFIFSPYIEANYFQHTSYVSLTTQNILYCFGFSGGLCFSLSLPFYRPLSFHLNGGCGIEVSNVNWTQPMSTDFMATGTFEIRNTFLNQLSVSAFFSYMFIMYMEPILHEIRAGISIGYRF